MADELNPEEKAILDLLDVYARPDYQLSFLPVAMRWEVTRRHPSYSLYWQMAEWRYRDDIVLSSTDQNRSEIAVGLLKLIGVATKPPSPAKEFSELDDEELLTAWRSGSVYPLTIRTLASLMIEAMSKETLKLLMMAFFCASKDDGPDEPAVDEGLRVLEASDMEELGKFFAAPYVAINPTASMSQIHEDIAGLLKGWKSERELVDKRDRSDKYDEYLKVWDLREGWKEGSYNPHHAMRLVEIAQLLKRPIATVNNQYRSAFRHITGHLYSPERWATAMGPIRMPVLHSALNEDIVNDRASWRRPTKSPTRRPVPESVLVPPGAETGSSSITSSVSTLGELPYYGLISDIKSLIQAGASKERVAQELEFPAEELPDLGVLYDHLAGI